MAKDSTGTIMLLAAAAAAVYGYSQGWFDDLLAKFGATKAAPVPAGPTAQQIAAQVADAATKAAAPKPVPPLGTVVHNAGDALAQVAAGDAYILPDAATFAQLQAAMPAGYHWVTTSDSGGILLRSDVYDAVSKVVINRIKRATGADISSLEEAGNISLTEVKTAMSTQGLTGLGDFRRHMYTRTGRALRLA